MAEPTQDTPTAVVFLGSSAYDSINDMARDFGAALTRLGYAVCIVDARLPEFPRNLIETVEARRVAFVFGINGVGLTSDADVARYFDERGVAFFSFFVDHPAYVLERLQTPSRRLVYSFTSPDHVDFCRCFVGADAPVVHLSHAAAPRPVTPWRRKETAVTFAGSLFFEPEPERARWSERHGPDGARILEAALELYDAGESSGLVDLVLRAGGDATPTARLIAYMRAVDGYLRCRVKAEAVRSLAPLSATVVGRGWERADLPGSVRVLGEMPARAALGEMDRARIALNLLPRYYHSHERIFQAAAGRLVPLSTPSPYLAEAFGADGIAVLEGAPRAAGEAVAALLADDAKLEAMAASAHAVWAREHTWDHRASTILGILNQRFGCPLPTGTTASADS